MELLVRVAKLDPFSSVFLSDKEQALTSARFVQLVNVGGLCSCLDMYLIKCCVRPLCVICHQHPPPGGGGADLPRPSPPLQVEAGSPGGGVGGGSPGPPLRHRDCRRQGVRQQGGPGEGQDPTPARVDHPRGSRGSRRGRDDVLGNLVLVMQ